MSGTLPSAPDECINLISKSLAAAEVSHMRLSWFVMFHVRREVLYLETAGARYELSRVEPPAAAPAPGPAALDAPPPVRAHPPSGVVRTPSWCRRVFLACWACLE